MCPLHQIPIGAYLTEVSAPYSRFYCGIFTELHLFLTVRTYFHRIVPFSYQIFPEAHFYENVSPLHKYVAIFHRIVVSFFRPDISRAYFIEMCLLTTPDSSDTLLLRGFWEKLCRSVVNIKLQLFCDSTCCQPLGHIEQNKIYWGLFHRIVSFSDQLCGGLFHGNVSPSHNKIHRGLFHGNGSQQLAIEMDHCCVAEGI